MLLNPDTLSLPGTTNEEIDSFLESFVIESRVIYEEFDGSTYKNRPTRIFDRRLSFE